MRAACSDLALAERLVRMGADVSQKARSGMTPLEGRSPPQAPDNDPELQALLLKAKRERKGK